MADLNTPISNLGTMAEPDKIDLNLGAAISKTYTRGRRVSFAYLPEIRAAFMATGVDPLRIGVDGGVYQAGLLPPVPTTDDLAAAPSGTRATAVLDIDLNNDATPYTIANGDQIVLYQNGAAGVVTFVTTLSASPLFPEIKIGTGGTAMADTLDNFVGFVNQSGTEGVDYKSVGTDYSTLITASRATFEVTITATDYGTSGNAYGAELWVGTWSDSDFGSNGTSVGSGGGTFEGGAAGSTPGPAAGTYRWAYSYYRSYDLAESALSLTTTDTLGAQMDVELSAIANGSDADYDFKRIYRTLVSGLEFFRVGEIPKADATFTDDQTDEDLLSFGSVPFDIEAHRDYYAGHIPKYRVVAAWKGRVWGGGAVLSADYTRGSADVDVDSATVNIQGGGIPTELMQGRRFRVTDNEDAEYYRIISVDESTKDVVLDRPYQAASKDPAAYEIVDDRDTTAIGCSEPGLPNQWPADNELTGITSMDPEGIVGVVPYGDFLFWFTRDGIWRLTGDSIVSWQLTQVVEGVGAVMQPITIPGGMMWLGVDGIYAWSGGGQPTRISSPPTEGDRASGIDGTIERISTTHAHTSHAVYDPDERVVRFFVPLDDDVVPHHAIVVDLGTRGTFSLDDAPGVTAAAMVPDRSGDQVMLLGDDLGIVSQAGTPLGAAVDYHVATAKDQDAIAIPTRDNLEGDFTDTTGKTRFRIQKRGMLHKFRLACFVQGDGAYGFEGVQAVSSATARAVTIGSAVLPTTGLGLAGCPVWVVRDTGATELARVASNTSTVLTLTKDLDYTPDSNDQVVIGAVFMDMETGRFDLGETRRLKSLMDLFVNHSPDAAKFTGYTLAVRAGGDDDR